MMKYKDIKIEDYNPHWPLMFQKEASVIREALKDNCIDVHHVGSTSVPGMVAKPTIDIITVIKDRNAAIPQLEAAGYQYKGEYNIPLRLFFNKKTPRDINLHVYEEGHPDIELNLLFRDYLRDHPEEVKKYVALKKELLTKQSSFYKVNTAYTGYNLGKDTFIREILNKAGFNRFRMMCCTHYEEWNSAKKLREQYFNEKGMKDEYDWENRNENGNMKDTQDKHVVFYKGTEIIGYAHIHFEEDKEATITIMVIEKTQQNKGFEDEFKNYIKKWIINLKG